MNDRATAELKGPAAWAETMIGGIRYLSAQYHSIANELTLELNTGTRNIELHLTPIQWEQVFACLNRAMPDSRKLTLNTPKVHA